MSQRYESWRAPGRTALRGRHRTTRRSGDKRDALPPKARESGTNYGSDTAARAERSSSPDHGATAVASTVDGACKSLFVGEQRVAGEADQGNVSLSLNGAESARAIERAVCVAACQIPVETREVIAARPWFTQAVEAGVIPAALPMYAAHAATCGSSTWCCVLECDEGALTPVTARVGDDGTVQAALQAVGTLCSLQTSTGSRVKYRLQASGELARHSWLQSVVQNAEFHAAVLRLRTTGNLASLLAGCCVDNLYGVDDCGVLETLRRRLRLQRAVADM